MPSYDLGNFSPIPFAALHAFYDAVLDRTKPLMIIAHCKRMPCIDIMDDALPDTYDLVWVRGYYLERMKDYREQLIRGANDA